LLESALARFEVSERRVPPAEAALSTGIGRLGDALREVRRISHALRPSMLDDLGLAAALEQLTRELSAQSDLAIGFTHVTHDHATHLPDTVKTALFRIAQEALTNIFRHAQATQAAVSLDVAANRVTLSVSDDGLGFDVERVQSDPRAGVGLRNMRERLEALHGDLQFDSRPGHTIVTATVPLFASEALHAESMQAHHT
jgi:two-component system NarL family sensor kinase